MPLPSIDEYRRRAALLRERAGRLSAGLEHTKLLKMAAQWERLAEDKAALELD